jgi:hypothetical protein
VRVFIVSAGRHGSSCEDLVDDIVRGRDFNRKLSVGDGFHREIRPVEDRDLLFGIDLDLEIVPERYPPPELDLDGALCMQRGFPAA